MMNIRKTYVACIVVCFAIFSCGNKAYNELYTTIINTDANVEFSSYKRYFHLAQKPANYNESEICDVFLRLLLTYPESRNKVNYGDIKINKNYDIVIKRLVAKHDFTNASKICRLAYNDKCNNSSLYKIWFLCAVRMNDYITASDVISNYTKMTGNSNSVTGVFLEKDVLDCYVKSDVNKYNEYKKIYNDYNKENEWEGNYISDYYAQSDFIFETGSFIGSNIRFIINIMPNRVAIVTVDISTRAISEYESSSNNSNPSKECRWYLSDDLNKCYIVENKDVDPFIEITNIMGMYRLHYLPNNKFKVGMHKN